MRAFTPGTFQASVSTTVDTIRYLLLRIKGSLDDGEDAVVPAEVDLIQGQTESNRTGEGEGHVMKGWTFPSRDPPEKIEQHFSDIICRRAHVEVHFRPKNDACMNANTFDHTTTQRWHRMYSTQPV